MNRKAKLLLLAMMGSFVIFDVETQVQTETVNHITLTVATEPRQILTGFGCSLGDLSQTNIPEAARAEMFERVFRDLGTNVLRLWVPSGVDDSVEHMQAEFSARYVDSGVIADAQKCEVTTLLLAPARGKHPPTETMSEYARKLADFIQAIRDKRGIRINVTGIANEPSGFMPEQLAEVVRLLRDELDARGLQDVAIIAPEWATPDRKALRVIASIRADPAAWAALRGIATHSYNMAATPSFAAAIAGTDKQYWMTEASANGNEGPADANRAASICARFLNDINIGVTHWIFFIGFGVSPDVSKDRDNATKFMVFDLKTGAIFTHLKYHWFRQLREAFPNGSQIYPLTAKPGGDLVFTYGQKPYLNAAAARRPDGSWSLAAVNLTGVEPDTSIAKWHAASALEVTWNVPALEDVGEVTFGVFRSTAEQSFRPDGSVVMQHGQLTISIQPRELVTLQSIGGPSDDP
jgi:hypothetical protein